MMVLHKKLNRDPVLVEEISKELRKCRALACNYTRARNVPEADVEDLVQTASSTVMWEWKPDRGATVATFLNRILDNLILAYFRDEKRRKQIEREYSQEYFAAHYKSNGIPRIADEKNQEQKSQLESEQFDPSIQSPLSVFSASVFGALSDDQQKFLCQLNLSDEVWCILLDDKKCETTRLSVERETQYVQMPHNGNGRSVKMVKNDVRVKRHRAWKKIQRALHLFFVSRPQKPEPR